MKTNSQLQYISCSHEISNGCPLMRKTNSKSWLSTLKSLSVTNTDKWLIRSVSVAARTHIAFTWNILIILLLSNCYLFGIFKYAASVLTTLPFSNSNYTTWDRSMLLIENVFLRICCYILTVVPFRV